MTTPLIRAIDKPLAGTRIWTADFIKLTIVTTLLRICTQVQITSMPLFFLHLGGSNALAGLSMTFFTLAALLTRPFIGITLDAYGRKPILLWGVIVYTISTVLYGFVAFIPALIFLRILHGISFSASSTATSTMVSDVLPEDKMTVGISYFGLFGTLAVAIAPPATLYLLEVSDYSVLYYLTGVVSLIALLISVRIESDKNMRRKELEAHIMQPPSKRQSPDTARHWYKLVEPRAVPPSVIVLFVSLATSAVMVFLPSFAIGSGIRHIGVFFVVQAAALALSRFIVGPWTARMGHRFVISVNLLGLGIALAGISFSSTLWELIIGAVLFGFTSGCLIPQLNAMAVTNTDPANRGKANATFYLAMDFGIGAGASGWGVLSDLFEMRWIFLFAGSLMIAALSAFAYMERSRRTDPGIKI
ncbi:MFS transporter [Paenibacillus sp. CCS19]|uniref:MFS transporter n=1 Tax=Paenibacillus sp. CCS19 TaxID=3158387 RepID=UPI00256E7A96|nr:MFS transporter [Paenibacillus cellulosilyticus]GMK41340.1 MFS transporter [Paenibacillus cellulosilyticus]